MAAARGYSSNASSLSTTLIVLAVTFFVELVVSDSKLRPNVVMLLVDDLGIGDIGCFGNHSIKTPNIDSMAARGVKLEHNLAPESLCTPRRAATLTGRYAVRSGLAAGPGETRVLYNLAVSGGLPRNETTIAKILQESGYKTGLIGKWHLGLNCENRLDLCHHPIHFGFQEFYGLPFTNVRGECTSPEDGANMPKKVHDTATKLILTTGICLLGLHYLGVLPRRTAFIAALALTVCFLTPSVFLTFFLPKFNCILMRGFEVVEQPVVLENLTVRFTEEAKRFITRNKDQPFFLLMSYAKVHTSLFTSPKFKGHSVHGRYGDNVEEMDWSVGEILSSLEKENLLRNTFVYFTSDHGPGLEEIVDTGEYCGGWAGNYIGGKGQSWEGGIRVPTVVMWKDRLPEGITINEPTNTMDIVATFAELAGVRVPRDRIIDSKNILPLITQKQSVSPHEFMFHYCGTLIHAVRYRPRHGNVTWKAHFVMPQCVAGKEECGQELVVFGCFGKDVIHHDPPVLYEITSDPYERRRLDTTLKEHQDIIVRIQAAMNEHQLNVQRVPRQLGRWNNWWNPVLQPCCNFPYCSCEES